MTAHTCHSCRHSEGRRDGLWCVLWMRWAGARCVAFEYEPGTDAGERGAR